MYSPPNVHRLLFLSLAMFQLLFNAFPKSDQVFGKVSRCWHVAVLNFSKCYVDRRTKFPPCRQEVWRIACTRLGCAVVVQLYQGQSSYPIGFGLITVQPYQLLQRTVGDLSHPIGLWVKCCGKQKLSIKKFH